MAVELVRATIEDAEALWKMQVECFASLLEKYQDFDTSPANEPLEKMQWRLEQSNTYYYFIVADGRSVGAIRVIDSKDGTDKRISPLFVLPAFQNRGIGQRAIKAAEALHGPSGWELDTILQEAGNCHLYEKMGYRQTGKRTAVNDKMTLVFYRKG